VAARSGFRQGGIDALRERLDAYVVRRDVPGLVALVARDDEVHVVVLGTPALDDQTPLRRDAIFRIASITKPIAAAGAMALIDDGVISLDDPVERYLPELAERRVLRSLESPLDDTVPAVRSITVEDVLTFRLGFGAIMAPPGSYPIQAAETELGLCTLGPPWPPPPFSSDEWIARFATLPLLHQPGADWRYNTGMQVCGVLIERASGMPLERYLRYRIFEPLGMKDTAFSVPAAKQGRFTTAYAPDPETGALGLLDPPVGGWWNEPPAMANGAGMLVSTIDDLWAFVSMLMAGGMYAGRRVLSAELVTAMTRDHLTAEQRASAGFFLAPYGGWGYGMAAPGPVSDEPPKPSGYGWNGGTGTTWHTDPARGLTAILLTQRSMTSPQPPAVFIDFWDAAYEAMTA
jgi:CubicO group peptidase (beta-lactamase class C family)